MKKHIIFDIAFIVILTGFLLILSETGNMEFIWKLPFITIYAAYGIGRIVGEFAGKERAREKISQKQH